MRKILSIVLVLTLILGFSAGCSNENPPSGTEPGSNSAIESNGGSSEILSLLLFYIQNRVLTLTFRKQNKKEI